MHSDPKEERLIQRCSVLPGGLQIEEILRKTRNRIQLTHGGSDVHIHQDFSGITLQNRRDLKLLLDTLRAKGIHYRWKFLFGLSAICQGRTALLRVPEDLQFFCDTMGIPMMEVLNWYAEFCRPTPRREQRHEEPMEAQDTRYRRHRSASGTRSHASKRGHHNGTSPSDSPCPRRARPDFGPICGQSPPS